MRVYVPKSKALTFSNGTYSGGEKREQTDATTELKQIRRVATRRQLRKSTQPRRKQA